MKLSTRAVLLVLGCLLPILAAQIYTQTTLRTARQDLFNGLARRQATLAGADVAGMVNAVAQLGAALGQFPATLTVAPQCEQRLASLQRSLPQYRFLAIYRPDGGLLCGGSATSPGAIAPAAQPWIADMAATGDMKIGPLVAAAGSAEPALPVASRVGAATADSMILVAGLDATWIAHHLDAARSDRSLAGARATLTIADRDGMVVARLPAIQGEIGQPLPSWLRPLADRRPQDVETVTDPDGRATNAAYVPVAGAPAGLAVIGTMAPSDVAADIDQAFELNLFVVIAAGTAALLVVLLASRRFIRRPAEALLLAARAWRDGELATRAAVGDAGRDFADLARSFNAMAAGLQARDVERKLQASFLEAQVAERAGELSESNNRLQVEIAGREKTEAALHQAQKLQAVGQLAGGIAHDFNNMLATVLGNLELMERRIAQTDKAWSDTDNDRLMRLIGRATGAVHRGSQLISRLLALSRRQRVAACPTDVNALLRDLITLASSTLGRRVQVVAELTDDLWPALVDPGQLEAAVLNLCLNARDAMPSGGRVLVSTSNYVLDRPATQGGRGASLQVGAYVRICVSDSGTGMAADVAARAFEPFFTTKGPAGSGLGLSQVHEVAHQCAGDVTLDSAVGEGTRVTLYLPRAVEAERAAAEAVAVAAPAPIGPVLSSDLVLVVDDDHAVRQVTVEMTRDLGCEVAQAAGGEQALDLIGKLAASPTLILLDYAMPGMNGIQLARLLRGRGVTAPIALVTGHAELSESDIAGTQLAGLLRKPFTILELQKLLAQLRAAAAEQAQEACLEAGLSGN